MEQLRLMKYVDISTGPSCHKLPPAIGVQRTCTREAERGSQSAFLSTLFSFPQSLCVLWCEGKQAALHTGEKTQTQVTF